MSTVITDELVAELELAAFKATKGNWCTDGASWVCASDSDQLNNGFVLAICEGPDANNNAEYMAQSGPLVVQALLAERAELKRRAAQGDWLIEYMASEREDLDDTLMEGCSDNRPHVLRTIIDAMQTNKE